MIRVLFVEDNDYVRLPLAKGLRAQGFVVVDARNLDAARLLFDPGAVDVLVTDYYLPDGNGEELARELQDLAGLIGQRLPCILLTGWGYSGDAFDLVVMKPVGAEEIGNGIRKVLS